MGIRLASKKKSARLKRKQDLAKLAAAVFILLGVFVFNNAQSAFRLQNTATQSVANAPHYSVTASNSALKTSSTATLTPPKTDTDATPTTQIADPAATLTPTATATVQRGSELIREQLNRAVTFRLPPLKPPTEKKHVVFIGDSLQRYAYLEWLDHLHYKRQEGDNAPVTLIYEKLSSSWHEFFLNSTQHFQGNMYCDCRRAKEFNMGSECENRYYQSDPLWATYLQLYGDNMAHGRILAPYANTSVISEADGPNADNTGYKWGYVGRELDRMISEYVSQFERKPTAITFSCGMWPNRRIGLHLFSALKQSRHVLGYEGVFVWRSKTKRKPLAVADLSDADRMAKEWSYRLPWLIFQPFPIVNTTEADYFDSDEIHFKSPWIYRRWNHDLSEALASVEKPKHRVFVFVGAVRTLRFTENSILKNLISPLCSPPTCIAHVITHFSYSDNRPSVNDDDPAGRVVLAGNNTSADSHFSNWKDYFPEGFFHLHKVNGYNIGSPEEQEAMNILEDESDPATAARMHMFRVGDPRRYSYWVARAWAWRYATKLMSAGGIKADLYAFARPDLLWTIPVPTKQFFDDFKRDFNEAWVHDTYFGHIADTFAILPSFDGANVYFLLSPLFREGVACLGGPNFNQTLVRKRLDNANITSTPRDWCSQQQFGWSERILRKKLAGSAVHARFFPASATIVRPPQNPVCQALYPSRLNGFATHRGTHVPFASCLVIELLLRMGQQEKAAVPPRLFRIQDDSDRCLAFNFTTSSLAVSPCQGFPYAPSQMFVEIQNETMASPTLYAYGGDAGGRVLLAVKNAAEARLPGWSFHPIELYGSTTLLPKHPTMP